MKTYSYIPLICSLALALAEPPVGHGYPSARSSYDHSHQYDHSHDQSYDFQRSLSHEYLPPASRSFGTSRNALSNEYGLPSTRTAHSRSGLSQSYGLPRSRLSQEYGVPGARSLTPKTLSTEYGSPKARNSLSQSYGAPAVESDISQEYGIPSISEISRTPSDEYGVPGLRTPSEEYSAPSQRSFGRTPPQKYGPPTSRSYQIFGRGVSQEYGVPSSRSGDSYQRHTTPRSFSKSFSASHSRSSQFGSRSLSTSYGAPSARNSGSYSDEHKGLAQTYGVPSQRDLSDSYGVPSARGFSQEYGVPASGAADKKTSAIVSSYSSAAARTAPSDTYGLPSGRDFMPSGQYGVPDQYSNLSNQGYSYARNGFDETLNQEPANYDFTYKVNDLESGSDFGHTETRQENRAEGTYFVVLPDGTKQVVEYEADERGFKPRISVEPAGGYDENAADLSRSTNGPY